VTLHGIIHVNIRVPSDRLAVCRDFYCDVLGLQVGWRPAFASKGFWLYADGLPIVHLVGVDRAERQGEHGAEHDVKREVGRGHPPLDHVAFRCTGYEAMLEKLEGLGIPYRISTVPGLEIRQVNITDPVGVGVELSYEAATEPPGTNWK